MTVRSQCPGCLFINSKCSNYCPKCGHNLTEEESTGGDVSYSPEPHSGYICDVPVIPIIGKDDDSRTKRKVNEGYMSQCPKCLYINTFGEHECPQCGTVLYDESLKFEYIAGSELVLEKPSYRGGKARYFATILSVMAAIYTLLLLSYVDASWRFDYYVEISLSGAALLSIAAVIAVTNYRKLAILLFVIGSYAAIIDTLMLYDAGVTEFIDYLVGLMSIETLFILAMAYHRDEDGGYRFSMSTRRKDSPRVLMYLATLSVYAACTVGLKTILDFDEPIELYILAFSITLAFLIAPSCLIHMHVLVNAALMTVACFSAIASIADIIDWRLSSSTNPAVFSIILIGVWLIYVVTIGIGDVIKIPKSKKIARKYDAMIKGLESKRKPNLDTDSDGSKADLKKQAKINAYNKEIDEKQQALRDECDAKIEKINRKQDRKKEKFAKEASDTKTKKDKERKVKTPEPGEDGYWVDKKKSRKDKGRKKHGSDMEDGKEGSE